MIFQRRQKALLWSKWLILHFFAHTKRYYNQENNQQLRFVQKTNNMDDRHEKQSAQCLPYLIFRQAIILLPALITHISFAIKKNIRNFRTFTILYFSKTMALIRLRGCAV